MSWPKALKLRRFGCSALSTAASFGVLGFSRIPVIHALGLTVALIVLDRPNPLSGDLAAAEGPILDTEQHSSFVGRAAIPIRHSLTVGELAQLWNAEGKLNAKLQVIRCAGWQRAMHHRVDLQAPACDRSNPSARSAGRPNPVLPRALRSSVVLQTVPARSPAARGERPILQPVDAR